MLQGIEMETIKFGARSMHVHKHIDMVKQLEYEKQRVERTERKNIIRIRNGSIQMNDGTFKRFYLHEL